ncbi:TonB-dependent receptor [Ideonella sp. 4Y16]|uniref:TonB-dependent receptor n=1 Tax=Ideonella alba TaxID=2824118 RepID=A0A940YBL4_9BURK|nr:TonB-dependent receptor [Ideonella alba]MBQ0931660.1 TonB-dependent receptor [Ideonella alba]MBQ0944094.1 TonB-dependent receptor [Ideonella alba]
MPRPCPTPWPLASLALPLLSSTALAQSVPQPAPAASAVQQVEVQAARPEDLEARRRSTASKIVVGRDEIERYGDSTLGELLKRLPGVTLDGRSGRGGNIRMRGMGGGYTQILLDGEAVRGGLSLDQLDPDQVERIEIIRAPTAETGARAIAGTINVITREGYRKRLNDLKLGLGTEAGRWGGNVSWSRDDRIDEDLTYSASVSLWNARRYDAGSTETSATGEQWLEDSQSDGRRRGVWSNARLQWKLPGGDQLMLMPSAMVAGNDSLRQSQLQVLRDDNGDAPRYATSLTDSDFTHRMLRLNGQWRQNLASGGRIEWRGGVGLNTSQSLSQRQEFKADGQLRRTLDERSDSRERSQHLNAKFSQLLEGDHQLVAGLELEGAQRNEERQTLQDGVPQLKTLGTELSARSLRTAAYVQDEFNLNPNWALSGGLRWEGITTRGQDIGGGDPENRSSVWTPLLHAVWKPDPKGRDQLRISITRSYKAPQLGQLMALPNLSNRYPVPGPNTPTSPDRAGNPNLQPELASGIDIALERYLPAGGLLSANLFHRRISGLMRTLTTLETVPWSDQPRWVARPANVGDAWTTGLELEARGSLRTWWPDAPAVDLRANASLFRSQVDGVPGPDNRLDQQPGATLNAGADWRIAGTPLTVGASVNWTPGYATRLDERQWVSQNRKQSVDAYLLWQIAPWARLRLSAANLAAEDALNRSTSFGETSLSRNETYLSLRSQLELKL